MQAIVPLLSPIEQKDGQDALKSQKSSKEPALFQRLLENLKSLPEKELLPFDAHAGFSKKSVLDTGDSDISEHLRHLLSKESPTTFSPKKEAATKEEKALLLTLQTLAQKARPLLEEAEAFVFQTDPDRLGRERLKAAEKLRIALQDETFRAELKEAKSWREIKKIADRFGLPVKLTELKTKEEALPSAAFATAKNVTTQTRSFAAAAAIQKKEPQKKQKNPLSVQSAENRTKEKTPAKTAQTTLSSLLASVEKEEPKPSGSIRRTASRRTASASVNTSDASENSGEKNVKEPKTQALTAKASQPAPSATKTQSSIPVNTTVSPLKNERVETAGNPAKKEAPLSGRVGKKRQPEPVVPSFTKEEQQAKEESAFKEETVAQETTPRPSHAESEKIQSVRHKIAEAKQSVQHFARSLKEQVDNYKPPMTRIQMQLDPKDLGSVEVTLVSRGNHLHVHVSSNPGAIGLMASQGQELKNQLVSMGFTDVQMQFNMNQQERREQAKTRFGAFYENEEPDIAFDSLDIIIPQYV